MKIDGVVVWCIYTLAMAVCAWAAFRCGAWILGTVAIIGAVGAVWGALKLAGAWDDPKPWDDGDGE